MENELTEELRVLVSAEVDKAIKGLKDVDNSTKKTESNFKLLGKTISAVFVAKEIINFGKQSALAFEESQRNISVLNATLQATGANAWTSSKEIQDMASSLQSLTNYDDDSIIKMQTVLLGFKNITGDSFEHATKAILDMATVMDMDLSSAAQAVGKALDDPINGITSLQRQGFRFSDSQKAVIQSLIDTGDVAAAQKIILDELDSTYGGAAESAVRASVQIKNAWGDLQEGVGGFLSGLVDSNAGKKLADIISYVADAFSTFHDNVAFLKGIKSEEAFNEYFAGLTDIEDQLQAATFRTESYRIKVIELKNELEKGGLSEFAEEQNKALLEKAEYYYQIWNDELQALQDIKKTNAEIQQQENDKLAAKTATEELMHSISIEYEKLSKDDPVVQLQNYQKQLEEIAKNKKTLSADTTGKDVSESLKQLDYNADAIKKKMKALRDKMQEDGVKSWQKYFEDITGVSESSFTTGKQAAQKYIEGLEQTFTNSKDIQEVLGNSFNIKDLIEDEMSEIEKTLTELLNIPADKIDSAYSTADDSVKLLIDRYKELNKQKKEFEVADSLKELQEKVDDLGKSEKELYIETLAANNATDEQIQKAEELFEILEKGNDNNFSSWDDWLEKQITPGIEKLKLFAENAEEANKSIAALGASLVNLSLNSTLTSFETLGKALGEGKDAGDSMKEALVSMSQEILDQLPTLFLQAGLQLIAQGQWGLGLGFVAAGFGTSFISGLNQGYQESLEKNALGGVYGDSGYEAFAKGGSFTNQIVTSPTLFKFASGGNFKTGLMGEAGPEAIMPLKRASDGSLGIEASGSGTSVQVLLEINNYSSEKVETQESTDEFGQKKLMVFIGSAINSHIANGKADKALSARYGLKAQGV